MGDVNDFLPPAVLEALRRYDSPTLSNAIEAFNIRPRDEGFARVADIEGEPLAIGLVRA